MRQINENKKLDKNVIILFFIYKQNILEEFFNLLNLGPLSKIVSN